MSSKLLNALDAETRKRLTSEQERIVNAISTSIESGRSFVFLHTILSQIGQPVVEIERLFPFFKKLDQDGLLICTTHLFKDRERSDPLFVMK
ncbi:MAG: hypothetical protein EOP06_09080, partial [Proteobacteria bacterium]